MSYVHKRHKVDGNQAAIVKALRAVGASVVSLASQGKGCPDLLAGRGGINYLLEVKDGSLSPSRRELTPDEAEFHGQWQGHVRLVTSVETALEAIGVRQVLPLSSGNGR